VSDLFCAATVIVARHAETEYDVPDIASDDGGSLTIAGREQARALAAALRSRRVAAVWCSDMARAVQTAEIAAAVLAVPVRVRPGLREFGVGEFAGRPLADLHEVYATWLSGDLSGGCPGAETGEDVVRRMRDELESLADQHRGETVLVVSHGGAMGVALPRLAGNVPGDFGVDKEMDNCGTCELEVDADGWVLRSWNGQDLSVYT
jgi:2,3-bisphosphoglycerate-dependent phosphoglycerate mutase